MTTYFISQLYHRMRCYSEFEVDSNLLMEEQFLSWPKLKLIKVILQIQSSDLYRSLQIKLEKLLGSLSK